MKPLLPSGTLRSVCRAYREAAVAYERAFVRGGADEIDDALSRMQEIAQAFHQGAEWALLQLPKGQRRPPR